MAEGILRHKLEALQINARVDSAGTSHYHRGEAPDPRAVKTALRHGVDISMLRARPFIKDDFEKFDLIVAMDMDNLNTIRKMTTLKEHLNKTQLLLHEIWPDEHREVPDPWYGHEKDFEEVYVLLNRACEALVHRLFMSKAY